MKIDELQDKCMSTAQYPGRGTTEGLTYAAFGLSNEAGEVLGVLKKLMRDDERGLNAALEDADVRKQVSAEVGDVLWYVMAVLDELDVDASSVAQSLIDKLASRKARGVISGSGDAR